MVEDTKLISTFTTGEEGSEGEEKEIETLALVDLKENVRDPGSDVREGDLVLQKGERITGQGGEIGTLAFVGRKEVGSSINFISIFLLMSQYDTGQSISQTDGCNPQHWK
jgi:hypothetical protein